MANPFVTLDPQLCISCGLCKDVCVLVLEGEKKAIEDSACLACGQCMAICPTHALFMKGGYDMDEVLEYDSASFGLEPDQLLNSIKYRRSIRRYLPRPVEREKLEQIIEAGRYTPSASNVQNVRYIIVEKEIALLESIGLPAYNQDSLFYGAPALILAVSPDDMNATLATMSMELMAEALGLGTLYVRMFTKVANKDAFLREKYNLQEQENFVTCLAVGYPAVQYRRTVPRKKAKITWS